MGQPVIVVVNGVVGEAHCIASVEGYSWWWAQTAPGDCYEDCIYPSHWMPLPNPPAIDTAMQEGK